MITGEGLVLRAPAETDRVRWLEMLQDPEQIRLGTPAFVHLPTTLEELTERLEAATAGLRAGEPATFAVASVEQPEHLLGDIAWRYDVAAALRVCDIGYVVHPDSRGQGVGRRAIRTLTRWLTVDDSGPHQARVQLDHSVENLASCRVATAAGFEREGLRRAFLPLRDPTAPSGVRRHDVCLHGFVHGA